jgi:hypothetical protein
MSLRTKWTRGSAETVGAFLEINAGCEAFIEFRYCRKTNRDGLAIPSTRTTFHVSRSQRRPGKTLNIAVSNAQIEDDESKHMILLRCLKFKCGRTRLHQAMGYLDSIPRFLDRPRRDTIDAYYAMLLETACRSGFSDRFM